MKPRSSVKRVDPHLQAFREQVALKYQLYNGLFLALPFEDLADTGVQLPLFANACREKLQAGKSPAQIVEEFFRDRYGKKTAEGGQGFDARIKVLFKFLQLVERQVVLFDALEDAAFGALNDLDGRGSLTHLLARVREGGKEEALARELADYRVRIVLTAHPTQFYPDSILGILTDLSEAIAQDRLPQINELLLQMGKTRFQNRRRPTPLDEARSLIWYLEHIFYPTLPAIQAKLAAALPDSLPSEEGSGASGAAAAAKRPRNSGDTPAADGPHGPGLGPKVELGFWPGGDRDGNPYVTSEITFQVAQDLKSSIINLYLRDLEALSNRLTFDGIIQPLQDARDRLRATLAPHSERLPRLPFTAGPPGRDPAEARDRRGPKPYARSGELLADLAALRRDLEEKHQGLFIDRLDDFIHKVQTFGFHFASLDLRQDSRVHGAVLGEILAALAARGHGDAAGYAEADEAGKEALLEKIISGSAASDLKAGFRPGEIDPLALDTLASLATARAVQKLNGPRGLHRYVISNTQSARNVLEVLALARISGWKGAVDLDVVPLFETVEDLEHAEGIMRSLYANPAYRDHLRRRGRKQTIMLGFSDGTKDGGYVTANWAIHKAKRNLTRVSREAGVRAVFFDGRGGPPARGGGNTHKFYRSLGADIEHTEIQMTIQGQTISSNFGTPEAARFNVEQLFTAGLEDKLFPPESPDLGPEDVRLLEELSARSREAYRRFKEHPLFLPYLEEMTPLGYYNLLNIASRPTRRKSASALRFEDLRAIPFVGAWSQMKQNIPGFYGVGEGLKKLIAQGKGKQLEDLYHSSLFFRTVVENAMMSLTKSYFPLTRYLEKDRKYGRFWRRIYDEATLSKNLLKEITGQHKLLENSPAVRESIHIREKLILPLLVIQQYAMGMVKAVRRKPVGYPREALDIFAKIVVKAMAANINAARNSA